jgi:hypothetical protein
MRDYINIGPGPYDEDVAQLGADGYWERATRECRCFIDQLRRKFGPPPPGASLRIKSFPHDFGTYREVVCYFDDAKPRSVDYCYDIEANAPERWDRKARECLKEK